MVILIRIPYDEMLQRMEQKAGLSRAQIEEKIGAKLKQLAGLISKEGAAHIVANELGVKLLENSGKIKDIYAGMRSVEFSAKVQTVYPLNTFARQDGTEGKVASCMVADETGVTRLVGWGDQAEVLSKLEPNTIIKVSGGMAKESNRGYTEIHVNEKSHVVVNPAGVALGEVKQMGQRAAAVMREVPQVEEIRETPCRQERAHDAAGGGQGDTSPRRAARRALGPTEAPGPDAGRGQEGPSDESARPGEACGKLAHLV